MALEAIFNAAEVLEIGIRIEENGEVFYSTAARRSEREDIRCLFEYLAAQERVHREIFSEMLRAYERKSHLERPSFAPEEEYVLYIRALADSRVFKSPQEARVIASTLEDPLEVLRYAYGIEKESILLYREIKDLVPEELGRDQIDRLIGEEQDHVRQIHKLEMTLMGPGAP